MSAIPRPQANPRKTTSVRQLGRVDIAALLLAVQSIPESTWDAENADKPNKFEALDKTRHIVFRFVDSTRDWRGSHDRPDVRLALGMPDAESEVPAGHVRSSTLSALAANAFARSSSSRSAR